MPTLPTAEWTSALDRMTAAVNDLLTGLNRSLAEPSVTPDRSAPSTPPRGLLADAEKSFLLWDERITSATELAAALDGQLAGREEALRRWGVLFQSWRDMMNRGGAEPPTPLG